MLTNLHVKNLALIKEEEIDFNDGLNILSGETGAGKSIIIGSINIALGEKASKEIIRKDADFALVELQFVDGRDIVKNVIKENDIELEPDDSVIISRKITKSSSVCKVNGESVALSTLRKITSLLVDVHGQHEHQSLLNKAKHLEILDEFASKSDIIKLKDDLAKEYKLNKDLKNKLEELNVDEDERLRNISFYEFEINEIDEAALVEGEDSKLEESYKMMEASQKIVSSLAEAYSALSDNNCASDLISNALGALKKINYKDEEIEKIESSLTDLESICSDVSHMISRYMDDNRYDEEKLVEYGKRLDVINHLKAKFGNSIEEIINYRNDKEELVNTLKNNEEIKKQCEEDLKLSNKRMRDICKKISEIRVKYAKDLEVKIINHLRELNFLDVRFEIKIEESNQITLKGFDDVEFMISTNVGEPVMPLGKIASGGELSRVMLAIKTVLAEVDEVGTLIFDEIDSGISGKTAWMVSEKLNIISHNHQVICISHLPQIAAMADSHYLIEKKAEKDTTTTGISLLDKKGEINELARMLGGDEITDAVLLNAKDLKSQALDKKLK
ncbi:MAG: DNA repair protein RecN [Lachnospiraceae bacterium]|nr:DNA repair protein RecN [Lachnospiraceae bacterium]